MLNLVLLPPGKVLWELIEPLEDRMRTLESCLRDMDPTLRYEIVPIYDPYGPTIQDSSLQCLYVSDETIRGGVKVNEERAKRVGTCVQSY